MILPLRDAPLKVSITRELGEDCLNQFPEASQQQRGTVPKKKNTRLLLNEQTMKAISSITKN